MTEIRRACAGDAAVITAAERAYIDCPWTEEQIKREIGNADAVFLVATTDGEFSGYVSGVVCVGELDVSNIAVAEKFRRRGVGERLLIALIDEAHSRGAETAFLTVRDGNAPATLLYRKCGFKEVGRRKNYYAGNADALIMRLDIK